jgi:hypothetical protein
MALCHAHNVHIFAMVLNSDLCDGPESLRARHTMHHYLVPSSCYVILVACSLSKPVVVCSGFTNVACT